MNKWFGFSIECLRLSVCFRVILPWVLLSGVGCQRAALDEKSSIQISIPSAQDFFGSQKISKRIGALSTPVDYNLLCFYANVRGPGIGESGGNCSPLVGVMGGGVGPGGSIELEVPSGESRIAEIYGVLRASATEPCQGYVAGMAMPSPDKIYYLGQSAAVSIAPPTAVMSVQISLPDTDQNLLTQRGWTTCSAPVAGPIVNNGVGRPRIGAATLSGSSHRMVGQAVHVRESQIQVGTRFKIQTWMNKE